MNLKILNKDRKEANVYSRHSECRRSYEFTTKLFARRSYLIKQ